MALAQSMALPPPSATNRSGANSFSRAVPSAASSTDGSGCTLSKNSTWAHFAVRAIRCAVPFFMKNGSVTSISRWPPIPASAETAPGPE